MVEQNDDRIIRKKDTAIELLRIIAILMVIGTHVKLPFILDGEPQKIKVFISCLTADGVAIFWFILGCFYFKGNNYKNRVKKLISRIFIPLVVISVVTFYLYNYIIGNSSLIESIRHSSTEYINVFKEGILKWRNYISGGNHLWYLYVYILVVLAFPVINSFKKFLEDKKIKQIAILLAVFLLFVFNDLSFNGFFNFSHHTFNAVLAASFWIAIGHIIYSNKNILKDNKLLGLFGLWLFICINIVRTIVLYYLFLKGYKLYHPLYWYTSFSVLSCLGLIMVIFSLYTRLNNTKIISLIINHIGSKIFYIYLIHMLVVYFLRSKGIETKILHTYHSSFIYQVLYTSLVFIVSLIIAEIITIFIQGIKCTKNEIK